MRKALLRIVLFTIILGVSFASCTNLKKTMREPNVRLELTKNDFTLSEQFTAEATSTRIIGIDFKRLSAKNSGSVEGSGGISLASLPVVGTVVVDPTANYALYELMNANPGYDFIMYPQYETKVVKPVGIGFLAKTTTVKVTARLGKLK